MARHSSARERAEKPHAIKSTRSNKLKTTSTISNDTGLAELVSRADAGETISQTPAATGDDSNKEKIEALTETICAAGEESAAALLVLMATFEKSTDPKALANTAKHLAFTRCGELNLYGIVDAQIALLEGDLLASNTLAA